MTNEQITTIIIAVLGANGLLTTLIVGIFDLLKKKMDKKSGVAKDLADIKKEVQDSNIEIKAEVKKVKKDLEIHIAKSERNKILTFNNDLIQGSRKTFEQFNEILDSIDYYEKYCKENDIQNDKINLAVEYIHEVYKQCQNASRQAPISAQMIGDTELRNIIADVLAQNQLNNH